jgi:hypothetical protein
MLSVLRPCSHLWCANWKFSISRVFFLWIGTANLWLQADSINDTLHAGDLELNGVSHCQSPNYPEHRCQSTGSSTAGFAQCLQIPRRPSEIKSYISAKFASCCFLERVSTPFRKQQFFFRIHKEKTYPPLPLLLPSISGHVLFHGPWLDIPLLHTLCENQKLEDP